MVKVEDVADRIRLTMIEAKKRPADLARGVGVSQPTVHGWLNKGHGITWENIRKVATFLKVPAGWLMFGTDEVAERTAQNMAELGLLRLYRDLDDDAQMSAMKYIVSLQHYTPPKRLEPRDDPPRPTIGGNVGKNEIDEGCSKVVRLPRMPA